MELLKEKHIHFVKGLEKQKDTFEYWASEHLKLNAVYWGVTTLDLLGALPESEEREQLLAFVVSCASSEGCSYGGNVGHDPHLLYTLSAVQLFVLFDRRDLMNEDKVARFIASLQQPDGSFVGDKWGEKDTRFSYCAVMGLALLNRLDLINIESCVEFLRACKNFDEAFGVVPGAESHAGQTFCCVAALKILGRLEKEVDVERLGWWLAERQLPCGGLNGRPEKKEDVCYSFWSLSCLKMLDRMHWIDLEALQRFILSCQDKDDGGISDRPENLADVFHLFFGICGLSMMDAEKYGLKTISAEYALPKDRLKSIPLV